MPNAGSPSIFNVSAKSQCKRTLANLGFEIITFWEKTLWKIEILRKYFVSYQQGTMRYGKVYRRMAGGPQQRLNLLRHFITALVKYERFEAPYAKAHETQKYAERLINIAKRGDTDEEAMKIADYWLSDKKQIHKLFKVLAPRFRDQQKNYTQLLRVPGFSGEGNVAMAFLEFHGNPYPPLRPVKKKNPDWIVNVLLREAVQELKASRVLAEGRSRPEEGVMTQLGEALDNLRLGESPEGAVADGPGADPQKDGTPV
ncbi:39S ribosomal protein L17, mitochondrial-like [Patiria miniata]|uniref:Large ribosomal subunit protein bL17m n=1 Tax=Patiria miniata TaxID=46514 RepID=A0A914ANS2_PATMI|nr:39S ribosomal protein L17, mitochondrial-like [Patiria miniata]